MKYKLPINIRKKEASLFNQMGGSTITNKAKRKKSQAGSGRDTNLSHNRNYYNNLYQSCANLDIPSENSTVDTQSTKKKRHMDSKIASLGITILPIVTVRPYILEPQHIHIPNISLILRLPCFVSPYHVTISLKHQM